MRRTLSILLGVVTSLIVLILTGLTLATVGCTSTALEYARARNPHCDVQPIEAHRDWARVRIACPDAAPRERTYGK